MKPGYQTTEFVVAVLVALASFIASIADYLPPRYAAIASAIVGGAYAVSRGLAKISPPSSPPTP